MTWTSRDTEPCNHIGGHRPTQSFLALPGWTLEEVREDHISATGALVYIVRARYERHPAACPFCGGALMGHGRRLRRIADTPHAGRPVVIEWQRQRYRCRGCRRTLAQSCPDVDDSRRTTLRLRTYVEHSAARSTFVHVADAVGLSEAWVRAVFRAYSSRQLAEPHRVEAPVRLGVDEVRLNGTLRGILVDLDAGRPIELLPTHSQAMMTDAITALNCRERVKVVTIDLSEHFRAVVRAALPGARVVADRFHVAQLATKTVNRVRVELGTALPRVEQRDLRRHRTMLLQRSERLNECERSVLLPAWFASLPALETAYALGQQLMAVYDAATPDDARHRLAAWYDAVAPVSAALPGFQKLLSTVRNWEAEILNYFHTNGASNGVTEAANRQLRDLERIGRGYGFATLRAKALLAPTPKRRQRRRPADSFAAG